MLFILCILVVEGTSQKYLVQELKILFCMCRDTILNLVMTYSFAALYTNPKHFPIFHRCILNYVGYFHE